MASTNQLQRAVNYANISIRGSGLTSVLQVTNEPALTIGDWVRQFILAPPFAWRWNRAVTTLSLVQGTQDYQQSLPAFGWLEKATIAASGTTYELENVLNLGEESVENLPTKIAARLDDDAGNITFRIFPVPDQAYTATLSYQQCAQPFANLTSLWTPIPDYFSYLYNQGFLAKSYEYFNDERQAFALELFIRQLIAANNGLDDTQRNIFLTGQINSARDQQAQLGNSASGRQARGLF